ncbi:retropepsin-like aspartic protease family protein [Alteromonas sp. S005]|uniref:retropepsin-like aspartic protease family protein n=1 Tax=Alteromonas sp. S005 TaxID=3117400 RepID=UPI002FE3EBD6
MLSPNTYLEELAQGTLAVKLKLKVPSLALSTLLFAFASTVSAIEQSIPLSQSKGGTLYLEATLESNVNASFLLDTGSSLLTLNQATFDALTRNQKPLATRTSAARMANGKIVKVSQYQLNSVRIGNTCEVGPVEVAVLPQGNNILGINTLLRVAPLTITSDSVILAGCD